MIKIGGELVGTQTIKSKGAYDERVNVEPNPTFENKANAPIEVDIAHVTVGDVNISKDIVGCFKASQGRFWR